MTVGMWDGTAGLCALWRADLADDGAMLRDRADPRAWCDAARSWFDRPRCAPGELSGTGALIGIGDVNSFRESISRRAAKDDDAGGGHGRKALIRYLGAKAGRLLRGRCGERVRRTVLSDVGEGTLLAAWMTYDIAPASGLAQRYFEYALALARAADDRLLCADVLDAMSQQALWAGQCSAAVDLARAGLSGTRGFPARTFTAHLRTMEARALARQGDEKACVRALSDAMTEFDRADPERDPEWIKFFDESELCAEVAHCAYDLGRVADALTYAEHSRSIARGRRFGRSGFLTALLLADVHLARGDADLACGVARDALAAGGHIQSARCARRLRGFTGRLPAGVGGAVAGFREQAARSPLWHIR